MSTTCNCETPELEKFGLVVVQPKASTSISRSLHGPIQGQAHDDLECVGRIRFDHWRPGT